MTFNPNDPEGRSEGAGPMSRRALFCAPLALAAPALLMGSPAWAGKVAFDNLAPLASTPCLDLYRDRERIDAMMEGATDDEGDDLYNRLLAVEKKLNDEPVTCLADLAAKVLVLTQIREADWGTVYEPQLYEQMEAILAEALA